MPAIQTKNKFALFLIQSQTHTHTDTSTISVLQITTTHLTPPKPPQTLIFIKTQTHYRKQTSWQRGQTDFCWLLAVLVMCSPRLHLV